MTELQKLTDESQKKMTNNISQVIEKIEKRNLITYKPTKEFYRKIGVKQKRWGQILRNEKQPDLMQLNNLSKFFNIKPDLLVNLPKEQELFDRPIVLIMNKNIYNELTIFERCLGNKQKANFTKIMNTIRGENLTTKPQTNE